MIIASDIKKKKPLIFLSIIGNISRDTLRFENKNIILSIEKRPFIYLIISSSEYAILIQDLYIADILYDKTGKYKKYQEELKQKNDTDLEYQNACEILQLKQKIMEKVGIKNV